MLPGCDGARAGRGLRGRQAPLDRGAPAACTFAGDTNLPSLPSQRGSCGGTCAQTRGTLASRGSSLITLITQITLINLINLITLITRVTLITLIGQAQFTSEVSRPADTLFGALVLATQVNHVVESIDVTAALQVAGVVAFVSAQDAKDLGVANSCAGFALFADAVSPVPFLGAVVGLLLAKSPELAERATKLVKVTYVKAVCPTPAVGVSVSRSTATSPTTRGLKGSIGSVRGSITTTGQKHFYLETQSTLAVPSAGALAVVCATQCISILRGQLCATLNKKLTEISVANTRSGGAYGGKGFLPIPIAAIACIAALRVGRAVLLQLDRRTDMTALGMKNILVQIYYLYMFN
jgi:xanthine dehydrogenase/oxidase